MTLCNLVAACFIPSGIDIDMFIDSAVASPFLFFQNFIPTLHIYTRIRRDTNGHLQQFCNTLHTITLPLEPQPFSTFHKHSLSSDIVYYQHIQTSPCRYYQSTKGIKTRCNHHRLELNLDYTFGLKQWTAKFTNTCRRQAAPALPQGGTAFLAELNC